jgi:transposase InsO family protein
MLMHATQGRCYGVGELEGWLREAGFTACLELPGGAARGGLIATRP